MSDFDIIVIGGGHAGIEAALAAARLKKENMSSYIEDRKYWKDAM